MKRVAVNEVADALAEEDAKPRKQRFVQLVEALARLRDVQYQNDLATALIQRAGTLPARNLPSNLLRAAAIFVDSAYGFPPGKGSFETPVWVTAQNLLPEQERGLMRCARFGDEFPLEENQVVILLADIPSHDLLAGMAGIVRELPAEDEPEGKYTIEFGEPEESATVTVDITLTLLRRPRPGDLIENYRL